MQFVSSMVNFDNWPSRWSETKMAVLDVPPIIQLLRYDTEVPLETIMHKHWLADRMRLIEFSGIRKVFDLAASLKNPVNLSIGQPHFPVPDAIKQAVKKE